MNQSESATRSQTIWRSFSKTIPTILVLGILVGGWGALHILNAPRSDESTAEKSSATGDAGRLVLPSGKIKAGEFQSEPVQPHLIQHVHVVPGRIQYDEMHHIDVKSTMDGILTQILVKPGDQVTEGQLLATVNSPAIGEARAEVLKRQADLELADRTLKRETEVLTNLQDFLAQLERQADLDQLEKTFQSRPLGAYRSPVQTAYSRFLLLNELMKNVKPLEGTGSVAGRVIRERESELQIARAEYQAAREQAGFEAKQSELEAQAAYDNANRLLKIAYQQLESLLGYPEQKVSVDSDAALSRLEIRAPFAGTIESRMKAERERVERSDTLMVLANTQTLYISADIRENDWPAVSLQPGVKVKVTVPALENRSFPATVHYVGREVNPTTNAVPLVATIDNSEGLLRPGMFVKVALPLGAPRESLSVRPESILHQDDREFVFVALGDNTFEPVDVSTGLASDDWIEIKTGLKAGQLVVQQGAFLLKSELLLEGESD